jgi:prefoldin subunit 5
MELTEKDLLRKKREIEQAKEELSELKGQEKALMKRLEEEYGITTIEQAEEKLESLQQQVSDLDTLIQEKTEAIEEKYFTEE